MRLSLRSTSTRTFVAWPAVVLGERLLHQHRPSAGRLALGTPLLVGGYLTYRACGRYRTANGGGPAGMSQGMPDRIVASGPYAWTRNPMYAGHLIFFAGLAIASGSPVAVTALAAHVPWFVRRVHRDEDRLRARFGAGYDDYAARVPRWLPVRKSVRSMREWYYN